MSVISRIKKEDDPQILLEPSGPHGAQGARASAAMI